MAICNTRCNNMLGKLLTSQNMFLKVLRICGFWRTYTFATPNNDMVSAAVSL